MQVRDFVEAQYPEFHGNVSGGTYPPPFYAEVIASLTGYIWLLGMAFMIGGSTIFKAIGIAEPEILNALGNNKMAVFVSLFMINQLGHGLLATGAFEVYIDGDLAFSKLKTGRVPNGDNIIAAMITKGYHLK